MQGERRSRQTCLIGLYRAAANFRASECRAELVRAMPSAAENVKKTSGENERIREISATDQVAILIIERD